MVTMLNTIPSSRASFPRRRSRPYVSYGLSHASHGPQTLDPWVTGSTYQGTFRSIMPQTPSTGGSFNSLRSPNGVPFYFSAQNLSFERLHSERLYLVNSLQREDCKATDLLKRITDLEETFDNVTIPSHIRKRARKQLGWLKYRMNETTRQEKSIIDQLGKVTIDIQQKERWSRIEAERLYRGKQLNQLNGSSPEFIPSGHPYHYHSGYIIPNPQFTSNVSAIELPAATPPREDICQPSLDDTPEWSSSISEGRCSSRSGENSEGEVRGQKKEKRHSLPTPSSSWMEGSASGSDVQYVGYYIRDETRKT